MELQFIDPGRFRRELVLSRLVPVPDGAGGYAESWADEATVYASLEPVRARAARAGEQALEHVTHRVTMRFRSGVEAGMRFTSGARTFHIVTAHDPDESGRYLVATVREDLP